MPSAPGTRLRRRHPGAARRDGVQGAASWAPKSHCAAMCESAAEAVLRAEPGRRAVQLQPAASRWRGRSALFSPPIRSKVVKNERRGGGRGSAQLDGSAPCPSHRRAWLPPSFRPSSGTRPGSAPKSNGIPQPSAHLGSGAQDRGWLRAPAVPDPPELCRDWPKVSPIRPSSCCLAS